MKTPMLFIRKDAMLSLPITFTSVIGDFAPKAFPVEDLKTSSGRFFVRRRGASGSVG
jgi:hypothetical protein